MSLMRQLLTSTPLVALIGVGCSSANPVTARDIKHYTGIELCPTAAVRDLTTQQERDTTPGFDFHASLKLDATCAASFERQLASIAPDECVPERVHAAGCYATGDQTKTAMHTTIIVRSTGTGLYDLRFTT